MSDPTEDLTVDEIGRAIASHAAVSLRVPIVLEDVDLDGDFFTEEGFALGDHPLDSMDLMEVITMIEDELGVSLLESGSLEDIASIRKIATLVHATSRAEPLHLYVQKWAS